MMDPKTLAEGRRLFKHRHKNMRFPGSFSAWTTWAAENAEDLLADAVELSKHSANQTERDAALAEVDVLRWRAASLESLVQHCWVHSGYEDCGYLHMDTKEKALYDEVKRAE